MKKIALTFAVCAALTANFSMAEERYVSDTYYIQLRADKSNAAATIKSGVASGTRLEFIREERGEDGQLWSLVQSQDGAEGWTRSANLINKPTAAILLAKVPESTRNAMSLQTENEALKQQLQSVQDNHEQLLTDTEDMRQAATTALNLEDENKRLHSEMQILQTKADSLYAENEYLRKNDMYSQWLYGGLLVTGGVLLSFLLQLMGRRRRPSEWR